MARKQGAKKLTRAMFQAWGRQGGLKGGRAGAQASIKVRRAKAAKRKSR